MASNFRFYYDAIVLFAWYSVSVFFDVCGKLITPSSSKNAVLNNKAERKDEPQNLSNFVKRIILVTQANDRVGSFFSVYQMNGGQQHCEYFYHERRFMATNSTQVSKIERALDLRRKALYHALHFYQDVLTHAPTKVYIYTDLADYNFPPEINAILTRTAEAHNIPDTRMEQIKHFSPNRLLHLITTENHSSANPHEDYLEMTMIQNASIQLQKNKVDAFKRVIGPAKMFSCISSAP